MKNKAAEEQVKNKAAAAAEEEGGGQEDGTPGRGEKTTKRGCQEKGPEALYSLIHNTHSVILHILLNSACSSVKERAA